MHHFGHPKNDAIHYFILQGLVGSKHLLKIVSVNTYALQGIVRKAKTTSVVL